MKLLAAGLSHPGRVRSSNEDVVALVLPPALRSDLTALMLVADGMGGHEAGEVASGLAASTVVEFLNGDVELQTDAAQLDALREALQTANSSIFERAAAQPGLRGMGTTCTAALAAGNRFCIGHVGDSRAYLLRDGRAIQLTADDSWVSAQVRLGKLTPEQAQQHPNKNLLLQAIGPRPTISVQTLAQPALPGDVLLLCSDGLTTLVRDSEIASLVSPDRPPEQSCRALIDVANQRGGEDNISVVLAVVLPPWTP